MLSPIIRENGLVDTHFSGQWYLSLRFKFPWAIAVSSRKFVDFNTPRIRIRIPIIILLVVALINLMMLIHLRLLKLVRQFSDASRWIGSLAERTGSKSVIHETVLCDERAISLSDSLYGKFNTV